MKQNKFWIFVLIALMGATLFSILRGQSLSELLSALKGVNPVPLVGALGLMFAFVSFEATSSRLILGALGERTTFRRCLTYSFAGFYVSSITPSASGGQPAQIYCMNQDGILPAHGALDMLLLAICYQLITLLYALTALVFSPSLLAVFGTGAGFLLCVGVAVLLLLTFGMLAFLWFPAFSVKPAVGILSLLARIRIVKNLPSARDSLNHQLECYQEGAALLKRRPLLFPALFGLMFLQITSLYLVPFMVYLSFGLSAAGIFQFLFTQSLLTLAIYCVPLPGGSGASEAVFMRVYAGLFGAAGVAPALLLSRGISCYGFLALMGILTAIIQVYKRGKKNGALPLPEYP